MDRANLRRSRAGGVATERPGRTGGPYLTDLRPQAAVQRALIESARLSPTIAAQSRLLAQLQTAAAGPRAPVVQAYGALRIGDQPAAVTPEEQVAQAGPEDYVILARGVSPTQRKYMSDEVIAGSHVSHGKMLRGTSDANVGTPSADDARDYVNQQQTPGVQALLEFSTLPAKSKVFGTEAQFGYLYLVRIQKKYLAKGSSGEGGWIARQSAPYEVIEGQKIDRTAKTESRMSADDIVRALFDEDEAEFLRKCQDPNFLGAQSREDKMRYLDIKRRYRAAAAREVEALKTLKDNT